MSFSELGDDLTAFSMGSLRCETRHLARRLEHGCAFSIMPYLDGNLTLASSGVDNTRVMIILLRGAKEEIFPRSVSN